MKVSARTVITGAAVAAAITVSCVRGGLWHHGLAMDNRLYFYIAERAASGVPPHVSTPDVKNQLEALVDAAAIRTGRLVGASDVRSGRIVALAALVLGSWGTGFSAFALGATAGSATLAALSVLAFSNLSLHAIVGFSPKLLLFALLAWGPFLVSRERFAAAGAAATAAMLCWQPAALVCIATAAAALSSDRRLRALGATIAGGVVVFLAYESYFAWHGVLAAQLFQAWALPLGSAHDAVDWRDGLHFVAFGSGRGLDHFGIPAAGFAILLAASIASLLRLPVPRPGRAPASMPAAVLVAAAGGAVCLFTTYDFQGEPDRFILCAYFAIALGVVADRALHLLTRPAGDRARIGAEVALAVALLACWPPPEREHPRKYHMTLDDQVASAHLVETLDQAYGPLWSYGCFHLMGLAHRTNWHPLDHLWDDIRQYVNEFHFLPLVDGRLPNAILRCRRLPRNDALALAYVTVPLPRMAGHVHLSVRKDLREPPPARRGQPENADEGAGRSERSRRRQRRT